MKSIEVSGKNVNQAIEIGLFKMETTRDEVNITVLDEGGLFSKARVKLVLKTAVEEQTDIEKFVTEFIEKIKLNVFAEVEENEKEITINLSGSDIGVLIGKRGDVLDSLQYILSQIINKNKYHEEYRRIIIDSEGYREKREDTLRALANRLADQCARDGKTANLENMSPAERRVIHTVLQNRDDVETISKGKDPNRYITIVPIGKNNKKNNKQKTQIQNIDENNNQQKLNRDYND